MGQNYDDLIFKFKTETIIYGIRVGTGRPSSTHIINKINGKSFCGYDNFIAEISIVGPDDEMFKPNFCKKCLKAYNKTIKLYIMNIESEIKDIKEFRKKNSRITTSTSHTYDFSDDIFDLIKEIKRSFKKNTIDIRISNNNVLISINNG